MKTVKLTLDDPRLTLFSNTFSFIVGTEEQHIDNEKTFAFNGKTLKAGTIFNRLGNQVLANNERYLEAIENGYYQFVGSINQVKMAEQAAPSSLLLFKIFDYHGEINNAQFAKENQILGAYIALRYVNKTTLAFVNSEGLTQHYRGNINILNEESPLILFNDE